MMKSYPVLRGLFLATTLGCFLAAAVLSAPPDGKENGGGKGGSGEDPPSPPPVAYDVKWIGEDDDRAQAWDVNQDGIVVGTANGHGMLYVAMTSNIVGDVPIELTDTLIDINQLLAGYNLPGHVWTAQAINADGRVVALCDPVSDSFWPVITFNCYDAFSGLDPNIHVFPGKFNGGLLQLSEDGAVGSTFVTAEGRESFLWTPGAPFYESFPISNLTGMNNDPDDRVIVGFERFGNGHRIWRYSLNTGEFDVLSELRFNPRSVVVNDLGEIASKGGKVARARLAIYDPFADRWEEHARFDGGRTVGINNDGKVCGNDRSSTSYGRVFIYDPQDGFWFVDDLVDDNQADLDKWFAADSGMEAGGMSKTDNGDYPMIAGYQLDGEVWRAFLLTPKP